MRSSTSRGIVTAFVGLCLLTSIPATASTIAIGVGAFGPGSTLTTFAGLASGTNVEGLVVDGIVFHHGLGPGLVVIDAAGAGFPGVTNNIVPPNIVTDVNQGIMVNLMLTFPSPIDRFGYG